MSQCQNTTVSMIKNFLGNHKCRASHYIIMYEIICISVIDFLWANGTYCVFSTTIISGTYFRNIERLTKYSFAITQTSVIQITIIWFTIDRLLFMSSVPYSNVETNACVCDEFERYNFELICLSSGALADLILVMLTYSCTIKFTSKL